MARLVTHPAMAARRFALEIDLELRLCQELLVGNLAQRDIVGPAAAHCSAPMHTNEHGTLTAAFSNEASRTERRLGGAELRHEIVEDRIFRSARRPANIRGSR